jgi:hypothetical protein
MRKPLAFVLTLCLGALAVGCEGDKPAPTKVPTSDLGAPAKPGDTKPAPTKPDDTKTAAPK